MVRMVRVLRRFLKTWQKIFFLKQILTSDDVTFLESFFMGFVALITKMLCDI